MCQKNIIPYLEFEREKIPTPIALSEILEKSWSTDVDMKESNQTVSQYEKLVKIIYGEIEVTEQCKP